MVDNVDDDDDDEAGCSSSSGIESVSPEARLADQQGRPGVNILLLLFRPRVNILLLFVIIIIIRMNIHFVLPYYDQKFQFRVFVSKNL